MRRTRLGWVTAVVGTMAVGAVGCAADPPPAGESGKVGVVRQAKSGQDGARTIASGSVILNEYAVLAQDAARGSTALQVTNVDDLKSARDGALGAGDLVLVWQVQGATIDTSNGPSYGRVTDMGGAGYYELVTVAGVQGNTIQLVNTCGLRHRYVARQHVQVVRVPQYTTLTIAQGATVTGLAWNGHMGGVVAVRADRVVLDGRIDVTGLGFRGGTRDNGSQPTTVVVNSFRSTSGLDGAEKGESVAGSVSDYDSQGGRYGRGAPANGGGEGNSHNAGGGGGANVAAASAPVWSGQGVMDGSGTGWTQAWSLDPAFVANGNALTRSSGGGRGGYCYSQENRDALTLPPGNSGWGGAWRRELGGWGGRPLPVAPDQRAYLGGGGGAGDANHMAGGNGGNGGGLVIVVAGTIQGAGSITANGRPGQDTSNQNNDAPGGGGGGGTILIDAKTIDSRLHLEAHGGRGGVQHGPVKTLDTEAEGPGGGGGGGLIAIRGGQPQRDAAGGANGITHSGGLTEFPPNGATAGYPGVADATITSFPICTDDSSGQSGCLVDADCGARDSGRVCQRQGLEAGVRGFCVPGCRGVGGNGCPQGLMCTSHSSAIGACVPIPEAGDCPEAAVCPDATCPEAAVCPDATCPDATCPEVGPCPDAAADVTCPACDAGPCPDVANGNGNECGSAPDAGGGDAGPEYLVPYGGGGCSIGSPGQNIPSSWWIASLGLLLGLGSWRRRKATQSSPGGTESPSTSRRISASSRIE